MLSPHALLIAAIFIPYVALMTGLGVYMWWQVRDHEKPGSDQEDGKQDGGGQPEEEPPDTAAADRDDVALAA